MSGGVLFVCFFVIVVLSNEEDGCYWKAVGKSQDAAQLPTMHRTALPQQRNNHPVNSVDFEKLGLKEGSG